MKKKNPFEQVKIWILQDPDNLSGWHEDFEDFKDEVRERMEDGPELVLRKKYGFSMSFQRMNGKKYNEMLIGSVFGDYEGTVVDYDCPECGHLLVQDNDGNPSHKFCSDCSWFSPELAKHHADKEAEFSANRGKEVPKLRVEGDTLEAFMERHGFREGREVGKECTVCKRKDLPVTDFYVSTEGYAIISFTHEDCSNGGPAAMLPLGKKKEEWNKLLFGGGDDGGGNDSA